MPRRAEQLDLFAAVRKRGKPVAPSLTHLAEREAKSNSSKVAGDRNIPAGKVAQLQVCVLGSGSGGNSTLITSSCAAASCRA